MSASAVGRKEHKRRQRRGSYSGPCIAGQEVRAAGSSASETGEGCCLWPAQGDGERAGGTHILWPPWREPGAEDDR